MFFFSQLVRSQGKVFYDAINFLFYFFSTMHAFIKIMHNWNKTCRKFTVGAYSRCNFRSKFYGSSFKELAHIWFYHLPCRHANIVFDCLHRDNYNVPIPNSDLILSSTRESIDHSPGFHWSSLRVPCWIIQRFRSLLLLLMHAVKSFCCRWQGRVPQSDIRWKH